MGSVSPECPKPIIDAKKCIKALLNVVTTQGKVAITAVLNASTPNDQRRRSEFREEPEPSLANQGDGTISQGRINCRKAVEQGAGLAFSFGSSLLR